MYALCDKRVSRVLKSFGHGELNPNKIGERGFVTKI